MSNDNTPALSILRRKQVEARSGLSRSAIYALVKAGKFPAPIDLGCGRSVGWLDHEVSNWIEQRIAESRHSREA